MYYDFLFDVYSYVAICSILLVKHCLRTTVCAIISLYNFPAGVTKLTLLIHICTASRKFLCYPNHILPLCEVPAHSLTGTTKHWSSVVHATSILIHPFSCCLSEELVCQHVSSLKCMLLGIKVISLTTGHATSFLPLE